VKATLQATGYDPALGRAQRDPTLDDAFPLPDPLAPQPLTPAQVADLVERTRAAGAAAQQHAIDSGRRAARWMRRDGGGRWLPDDPEVS